MGIKNGLSRSWRAWGQWNNIKELLDLFGWKDWLRDQAIAWGLSAFAGGGVIGMFTGAITIGSPIGVLLSALAAGVLAATLAVGVSLARALSRFQPQPNLAVGDDAILSPSGAVAPSSLRPKDNLAAISSDIPNVRVADCPAALELFDHPEQDKLLPLLEAEKLIAWARPMKPISDHPALIKVQGAVWRDHVLEFFPRGDGPGRINQTFIRTRPSKDSIFYDVFLNAHQLRQVWPNIDFSSKQQANETSAKKPDRPLPIALSLESLGSYMRTSSRVERLDRTIASAGRWQMSPEGHTLAFGLSEDLKNLGVANIAEVDALLEEKEELVLHSATHWIMKDGVISGQCVWELCKIMKAERGKDNYTKKIIDAYLAAKVVAAAGSKTSIVPATLTITENHSAATVLNYYDPICAITIRNIGDIDLTGAGLIQIEQISLRPKGMPLPLVLRTENQIREKRTGRFTLSAKQPKTVPIVFSLDQRPNVKASEWILFDSQENYYGLEPKPVQMVIGVYGGEKPSRALVSMEPKENSKPHFTVETVPLEYSLPGNDNV
ncbi:hypothetical protein [Bradyrhizobium stylosanthis]|uniref:Uncharacterized protein n=1 Tax=Bradyrhizobium stylosanthis TaxID=1803665 RepID=A0A560DXF3_9BRAD|nr:hypothetical protein [Bradyrhizobium stylosanthis]TWB01778.1 hypothetical protein FBZ96_103559 [Bradyrhizobium stylosanthis]